MFILSYSTTVLVGTVCKYVAQMKRALKHADFVNYHALNILPLVRLPFIVPFPLCLLYHQWQNHVSKADSLFYQSVSQLYGTAFVQYFGIVTVSGQVL